jgi:uncharacterized lipoprotein
MIRAALLGLAAILVLAGCATGDVTESGVEQSYKEQAAKADALNEKEGVKPMEKDPNEPQ